MLGSHLSSRRRNQWNISPNKNRNDNELLPQAPIQQHRPLMIILFRPFCQKGHASAPKQTSFFEKLFFIIRLLGDILSLENLH